MKTVTATNTCRRVCHPVVEDDNHVPPQVLKQKAKSKGPLFTVLFYGEGNYSHSAWHGGLDWWVCDDSGHRNSGVFGTGFFGPDLIRPFDRDEVERDLKAKKFKSKDLELAVRQALDPSLVNRKSEDADEEEEEGEEGEDEREHTEEDESIPAEDDVEEEDGGEDDAERAIRRSSKKAQGSKSTPKSPASKGRKKSDASGGKDKGAKNGATPGRKDKRKSGAAATVRAVGKDDEPGEPMEEEEEEQTEVKDKETKEGKEKKSRRLSKRMAADDDDESANKMDVEDKEDDRDRKKRRKSTSAEKEDDHKPSSRRKSAAGVDRKDRPNSGTQSAVVVGEETREEPHSPAAGHAESRSKRDNSEEGDEKQVPATAGEDKDFKTKQKKLYHLRHKLQRMVYDKTEIPKEDYVKIHMVLHEVEQFTVTFPLLRETKIGKVMKAACAQNYPDDEYNLKDRASQLMKNWKALLPTTEPESGKDGENGAHASHMAAGEHSATESGQPDVSPMEPAAGPVEPAAGEHEASEHHNGLTKKDDATPMDVDDHAKDEGAANSPMEHDREDTAEKNEPTPSVAPDEAKPESLDTAGAANGPEDHAMAE
ncbi:hypothetical protein BC938DRAFT_475573 [Jimgerdemannia flammicorona]|uniref:TFIIS N-terminal domain-containing protein n=1 Tax=Jimgerdemannia flammicorona TaxID=994334 RepID=A0A433PS58_9FUNG|nr:hypothetical protein BC938DRAFT_475573 [Jimgerdemannia flammicorona]